MFLSRNFFPDQEIFYGHDKLTTILYFYHYIKFSYYLIVLNYNIYIFLILQDPNFIMDFTIGQPCSQTKKDEDLSNSEPNENEFPFTLENTNYISKVDTRSFPSFEKVRKEIKFTNLFLFFLCTSQHFYWRNYSFH